MTLQDVRGRREGRVPARIRRVGKGAAAPTISPSVRVANGGHASAFALPPTLVELRRTGRAMADKPLHPSYWLPENWRKSDAEIAALAEAALWGV